MGAMRLTFDEIKSEIKRVLVKYGMSEEKAETCARIHTETTYDCLLYTSPSPRDS